VITIRTKPQAFPPCSPEVFDFAVRHKLDLADMVLRACITTHARGNRRFREWVLLIVAGSGVAMFNEISGASVVGSVLSPSAPVAVSKPAPAVVPPSVAVVAHKQPQAPTRASLPVLKPGEFIAYDECEACDGRGCQRCGGEGLLLTVKREKRLSR
jgi:hypothetical protein